MIDYDYPYPMTKRPFLRKTMHAAKQKLLDKMVQNSRLAKDTPQATKE